MQMGVAGLPLSKDFCSRAGMCSGRGLLFLALATGATREHTSAEKLPPLVVSALAVAGPKADCKIFD